MFLPRGIAGIGRSVRVLWVAQRRGGNDGGGNDGR
jgi:hypothetical protein